MSHSALGLEFVVLFVALPVGFRLSPWPLPALPVLWLAAFYCWWTMRKDPAFSTGTLWSHHGLAANLPSILGLFLTVAAGLWLAVRLIAPESLFSLVRTRPGLWAMVMVFYPVLSVYPQGIIYRSFLMHRYAAILPGGWGLIVISAGAFAWMHLVFRNKVAVALTFAGGLLFAWRYAVTGSLLISSIEHALYGCWLFTVGLEEYFYHGGHSTQITGFRGREARTHLPL